MVDPPVPMSGPMTAPRPTKARTGLTLANSLGLVAVLVAAIIGAKAITDNSLLTHLATGELIIDNRAVPTTDPYSRTAPGLPWTVQSWLASVIYASIDRMAGGVGLRLLHGAVAGAIGAGLWRLTSPARQVVPRTALTMVPIMIGGGLWAPRPFMFGLLALVALLIVVGTGLRPWLLVPLFWLWMNSHGSFPLGLALLGAMWVGAIIDGPGTGAPAPSASGPGSVVGFVARFGTPVAVTAGRYLLWGAAGVAAGVVNPIGPRLLVFPIQLLSRREALDGVVEWQPPSFSSLPELLFLGLVPLVAVAARRGAPWQRLIPSVCFLLGGFLAIRNIAVAAIVVVVLLAPSFSDVFGTDDGRAVNPISRIIGTAAVAGVVAVAAIVAVGPGFDLKLYPVDEVDFLEANGLAPSDEVNLIHREAVGNYLAFRYGPESSVFIDDRFDFYPTEVTDDHLTLLDGGDYNDVLERRRGDVVLWEADSLLARWLTESDDWELVVTGDDWIVACRVGGPVFDRCR